MEVSEEELREVYERLPPSYDRVNAHLSFWNDVRWRLQLVKVIEEGLDQNKVVLDAGSGRGELSFLIARRRKVTIIDLDYSVEMLRESLIEVERVIGSFEALPFRDRAFDTVMSSFAIHAASNFETVIEELSRVSRGNVGAIFMGKTRNILVRLYVKAYMRLILPEIAKVAGGDAEDYLYIYKMYERNHTNDWYREKLFKFFHIRVFRELALGTFILFVGIPRSLSNEDNP
jgi:demethylmenaquinone methyltransferase/2-methoxy-6-polyprenyl-1,4-benzoquinol methylase